MRRCPKCEQDKPTSEFGRVLSRGTVQPYCKQCRRDEAKRQYDAFKEKYPDGPPTPTEKRCSRCDEVKPASEFFVRKTSATGLTPQCRDCERYAHWYRKYGLLPDEVRALLTECAICGATDRLVVDHCHATGKIRAGLCHTCNLGIGQFFDDPDRLRSAADYLESHA